MAAKPNLRPISDRDNAERSPERQQLADAIAEVTKAERDLHEAQATVERARKIVSDATDQVEKAEAETRKAQQGRARGLAAAASQGTAPVQDRALRNARADEQDARDQLEAAQSALAEVEGGLTDAKAELERARQGVRAAADDVLRAAPIPALLAEAQKVQAELIERRLALRYLLGKELVRKPQTEPVWDFLNENLMPGAPAIRGIGGGFGSMENRAWDHHPRVQAWANAREALLSDPDADLPLGAP